MRLLEETYPYWEYPKLIADKNWIEYDGKKYNILYVLDEGNTHEWLQVFTNENDDIEDDTEDGSETEE